MKQCLPYEPLHLLQGPARIQINEEDIPNVFFTSDTHFHHKNILHFTNRQFVFGTTHNDEADIITMNNTILDNIKAHVSSVKTPILIHCGDLMFGSRGKNKKSLLYLSSEFQKIPNLKIYNVIGNHDVHNIIKDNVLVPGISFNTQNDVLPNWYWNFIYLVDILRNGKIICQFTVSHIPMQEFFGWFNVHGHLHSEADGPHPQMSNHREVEEWRQTHKHYDVGCDNNHYQPVPLTKILENKTHIRLDQIPQTQNLKFRYEGYEPAE